MPRFVTSMRVAVAAVVCLLAAPASALVASPATVNATSRHASPACGGLGVVGDDFCTHGGDHIPGSLERQGVSAATATRSTGDECVGDGRHGPRIRVYYGFPSDTIGDVSSSRASIRQSVTIADTNLDDQTPGMGGQHLRMYCGNDARVTITSIALLPIGGDNTYTFNDVIDSLVSRVSNNLGDENIDIPRFTYAIFVDNVSCCFGPAGQGTVYWDDRAGPERNFNNRVGSGPRFAMIELRRDDVADAFVFLHEVGHTLGAVQISAPHSTGGGHCYTAVDVMCSFDGGSWFAGGGTMESVCPQPPVGEFTFDCKGRDYYDVDPPARSYLARHWNTADSRWLTRPG